MYSRMDRDGSGSLDFDEFLMALRNWFYRPKILSRFRYELRIKKNS